MALRLYDSATQSVRDFKPRESGRVGIYICGLTVQSEPHVGHVRSAVNFDVLRRWLLASRLEVHFIRNVTDIDDKILAKAAAVGRTWYEHASVMKRALDDAYAALNVMPPSYEPTATGHIPEQIDLIEELINRGHAYPAANGSGDVYFDVRSWARYGELTHQSVDDMEPAADADPRGKKDPRDFALWKGRLQGSTEPGTASWPSPWGRGRPGWHIECSAMAGKYLGPAFDIHGGGLDLRFPHHENELAQSRAAGRDFAAYWMHNAWITTSGEKMSKSLGNSLTIPVVLQRYRGIELRYYLLAAHYRSHVEFSFAALDEAAIAFRRIENFLGRAGTAATGKVPQAFAEALNDDLGTPAAIAVLHDTVRRGNSALTSGIAAEEVASVRAMLNILGLDPGDPVWGPPKTNADDGLTAAVDSLVQGLLAQRAEARAAQDWAAADAVRNQLNVAGIAITDTSEGPKWSLS